MERLQVCRIVKNVSTACSSWTVYRIVVSALSTAKTVRFVHDSQNKRRLYFYAAVTGLALNLVEGFTSPTPDSRKKKALPSGQT